MKLHRSAILVVALMVPSVARADVTEFGMHGTQAINGTLYAMDVFMLDADFLPGAHETFAGALFATGGAPKWTVVP